MTMIGLLMFVMLIIVVAVLMPTISYYISLGKNGTTSVSTQVLLDLVPIFIVLWLIITLFIYITPYRQG